HHIDEGAHARQHVHGACFPLLAAGPDDGRQAVTFLCRRQNFKPRCFAVDSCCHCAYIATAQSRTCLWVSAGPLEWRGKTVRYPELTPPVAYPANRKCEDILKQRRCGPFWCLPVFQQPGLLKRHTFIAGRAVGLSRQSMADKAELKPRRALIHRSRRCDCLVPGSRPAGSSALPHL